MNHLIYQHPDGQGLIQFDDKFNRLFVINHAEWKCSYAVIGYAGLRDIAASLLALADEMEATHA